MSWLCLVCETENPEPAIYCEVCRMERLYLYSEIYKKKRSLTKEINPENTKELTQLLKQVIQIGQQQQLAIQNLQENLNQILTETNSKSLGIKKPLSSSLFGRIFETSEKPEYLLNETKLKQIQEKLLRLQNQLNEIQSLPVTSFQAKLQLLQKENISTEEKEKWKNWWNGLSENWKQILSQSARIDSMDVENIYLLRKLKSISAKNLSIETLEPVQMLKNLTRISLEKASIDNLEPIQNLSHLQKLNLAWNPIHDLTPLENIESLQELNLKKTLVYDISPLQKLRNLKKINLFGTSVFSLEPLLSLPLVQIDIRQTKQLSDWERKRFQLYLPKCKVLS